MHLQTYCSLTVVSEIETPTFLGRMIEIGNSVRQMKNFTSELRNTPFSTVSQLGIGFVFTNKQGKWQCWYFWQIFEEKVM